jgi:hypothetical protein
MNIHSFIRGKNTLSSVYLKKTEKSAAAGAILIQRHLIG